MNHPFSSSFRCNPFYFWRVGERKATGIVPVGFSSLSFLTHPVAVLRAVLLKKLTTGFGTDPFN